MGLFEGIQNSQTISEYKARSSQDEQIIVCFFFSKWCCEDIDLKISAIK